MIFCYFLLSSTTFVHNIAKCAASTGHIRLNADKAGLTLVNCHNMLLGLTAANCLLLSSWPVARAITTELPEPPGLTYPSPPPQKKNKPSKMLSFLAKHPPRSTTRGLTSINLDGGRSIAEFKPSGDTYLVINRLPPALSPLEAQNQGLANQGANSSLAPPLHRHLWQDETFHVISGTARFITIGPFRRQRQVRLASAGDVVVIPRREAHTFCNASEETELVIEFALSPINPRTDEAYFRELNLCFFFSFSSHPHAPP